MLLILFFFFSSRRRHTRLQGDWSSDVCSSDLSTRQGRGLDACFAERLATRRRDVARAWGIAVDADRVVTAGPGEADRLLRGNRRAQDGAGLAARRKAAVRQHETVGEALPVRGNSGPLGGADDLETGLTDKARGMRLGDPGQRVGRCGIALAAVVQGAVRLDIDDRRHGGESCDLERDQRLDVLRAERTLDAAEAGAIVIPRVRADLDAQLAAPPGGGDGKRRGSRMDAARDVGAVDAGQDRLVLAGTLADVSVEIQEP